MAVTRINNNQITDASAGNVYLGINANTKLQNYSITSQKIANNLTYGSDLTVSGNLTVNGTSTAIDTTITTIEDPVIVLASTQTGSPTVDIGFLGERGTANNIAFVWNEANSEFVTAFTSTSETNTTISILSYANLHTNNMVVGGTTSLAGNVLGTANFSGNVNAANVSATGNITATYFIGNISGNIDAAGSNTQVQFNDTGDILGASAGFTFDKTANSLTVAGTITGGNLATGGTASASGNITGGNVLTGGLISATGNITGGNLISATVTNSTAMTVSTTAGNINLQPSGNIVVNNTYINGVVNPVQNQDVATKIYVDNAVTTAISYHEAVVAATVGNLAAATGGTITYAQPNGVANGVGATLTTTGTFNLIDTANVQTLGTRILVKDQANAVQNGVYVWSNATVITRSSDTDTYAPASANALSINDYFFVSSGNVNAGSAWIVDAPAGTITFGTSNIQFAQFSQSQVYTANTSAGLILNGTVFSTKVDNNTTAFDGGGNISVKAGANLTTPNIGAATGTSLSVTGNITGGNIISGNAVIGNIQVSGDITVNSLTSNTYVSAIGTVTAGNLATGGTASVTGNITGGNIATTGVLQGGNIVISGDDITDTNGRVNFNTAGADVDFAVNGDTVANVFYVDAATGTASFGSATQTTNAIVAFNSTTSIVAPVGNTAQRPATGVTGMLRFNSTNNNLELYDNTEWTAVGVPVFTVIADQQFNGDGSNVAFTLSSTQTTNSCIVSINGVVQIPTLAYAVAGTNPTCVLTFTEAPAVGDVIDVRQITTTTSVTSIANSSGNAIVATSETAAQVNVTGDLSVSGTILGGNLNSTAITFGTSNMSVVASGGNIRANIAGTTVQTISPGLVAITGDLSVSGNATLSGNILGDRIQNGTTQIDIQTPGGNANINIGGTGNLAVFSPGALNMTGNILPTANITYNLGSTTQRWNDLWLSNSTIYLGNSQISANATSLIFTNPQGGQTVLAGTTANITAATVSTTGNVTGGNILTGGLISASGNITSAGNISVGIGTLIVGNIVSAAGNGVGNIGSPGLTFNTIFAKATSAQYADLAEKYTADAEYAPGTVVSFGGTHEVTLSTQDADRRVAGVVSTNPSYIMNGGLEGANVATVALTGRVPTRVTGTVAKGDLMVSNGDGTARAEADPRAGAIIGKALEDFADGTGTIEVVIGRF
jgi:mucin-19